MTTFESFIQASASYFGIPMDQLTFGSTLDVTNGEIEVVLRVALTQDDMAGITKRMERLALAEKEKAEAEAKQAQEAAQRVPGRDEMRSAWNSLTEAEKSRYGSFHRFVAMQGGMDPYGTGTWSMPGPEPEPVEVPKVVWLTSDEATDQQKCAAIGMMDGKYGIDPDDLTPEQRASRPWVRP